MRGQRLHCSCAAHTGCRCYQQYEAWAAVCAHFPIMHVLSYPYLTQLTGSAVLVWLVNQHS